MKIIASLRIVYGRHTIDKSAVVAAVREAAL